MGAAVRRRLSETGHLVVAAVDKGYTEARDGFHPSLATVREAADIVVDFSHHDGTEGLLRFCLERRLPLVIATTGQTAEQAECIRRAAAYIPIFFAANLSLGAAFLMETVRRAAGLFPEAEFEIVETHHREKRDAPSGTARMLLSAIGEVRGHRAVCGRSGACRRDRFEVGVHSLRLGNASGEHTVVLSTGEETLILTHRAESRLLFAKGAVAAMEFLMGREAGLYGMAHLLAKGEGKC